MAWDDLHGAVHVPHLPAIDELAEACYSKVGLLLLAILLDMLVD